MPIKHYSFEEFDRAMKGHECDNVSWVSDDDVVDKMIGYRCRCGELHQIPLKAIKVYLKESGDVRFKTCIGREEYAVILNSASLDGEGLLRYHIDRVNVILQTARRSGVVIQLSGGKRTAYKIGASLK